MKKYIISLGILLFFAIKTNAQDLQPQPGEIHQFAEQMPEFPGGYAQLEARYSGWSSCKSSIYASNQI